MSDFLPKDEPGIDNWFENYGKKMDEHGAEHGFTAAEIKQAKDDAKMVHNIVIGSTAVETFRREYVGFKRITLYGAKNADTPAYPTMVLPTLPVLDGGMLAGIIQRMRSDVRKLKESKSFNESVAADFRVQPVEEQGAAPDEAKPALKGRAMAASTADVDFVRGKFDGVELERQRGESDAWDVVGRFFRSPAEDDAAPLTPNTPEVRRYRARFLDGNKAIGLHSDIISVVTTP